jgi:hypothetical protein
MIHDEPPAKIPFGTHLRLDFLLDFYLRAFGTTDLASRCIAAVWRRCH